MYHSFSIEMSVCSIFKIFGSIEKYEQTFWTRLSHIFDRKFTTSNIQWIIVSLEQRKTGADFKRTNVLGESTNFFLKKISGKL